MPSPTDFRTMLNFFIFCNSLLRFQSVFRFVVFWSNVLFWLFRCQGIVARKEAPTTSGPALPRGRCRPGHFIRTKEVEWTETGIRTWARFTREGCWGAGLIKFQHFFSNATKKNVPTWALLTKKAPKGLRSGGQLTSRGFVPFLPTFQRQLSLSQSRAKPLLFLCYT
jgi:hypothetical protein